MLNFPIDANVLEALVPRGTEVDSWNGTTYISLVAFSFIDTRVRGLAIPLHRDFEEINLRFYVRSSCLERRRGVVFVREVVPRSAIAAVAKWLYNENYVACPTRSNIVQPINDGHGAVSYGWRYRGQWLSLGAEFHGPPKLPAVGSAEEFITEHYWGYSSQRDGSTVEYQVEHPQWRVWPATQFTAEGDFGDFYGAEFGSALAVQPASVFVADGSPVTVRQGAKLAAAV
jgi:uncharacterized protein YqjF (DUF2071 family)